MNVLNLFFSSTGNTEKVALKIEQTIQELGHKVETVKVDRDDVDVDVLEYDFVFVGSGVYGQMPGEFLIKLQRNLAGKYGRIGEIKPNSPKRPSKKVVVYCTYGGVHTGINEALPTIKYLGQLYDHLGYTIVGEWDIVGEYNTDRLRDRSINGRLGDIRGRLNQEDLKDVAGRVKGILKACQN